MLHELFDAITDAIAPFVPNAPENDPCARLMRAYLYDQIFDHVQAIVDLIEQKGTEKMSTSICMSLSDAHKQIATNLTDATVMLGEMQNHVDRLRNTIIDTSRPDRNHVLDEISDEMLSTLDEICDVLGVTLSP